MQNSVKDSKIILCNDSGNILQCSNFIKSNTLYIHCIIRNYRTFSLRLPRLPNPNSDRLGSFLSPKVVDHFR